MIAIDLIRSAWLKLYLERLSETDYPHDDHLMEVGLPTFFDDDMDQYISMLLMSKLIANIEKHENNNSFAISAAQRATHHFLSKYYLKNTEQHLSLESRLMLYCRYLPVEWSSAESWIDVSGKTARVYNRFNTAISEESARYLEWLQCHVLTSIVRDFAGPGWTPRAVAFHTDRAADQTASDLLPGTRALFGRREGYMEFPAEILALSLPRVPKSKFSRIVAIATHPPHANPEHDFVGALKLAVRAYLPDYYPSLDVAAGIAGVGARTLQRRLAQFGLTYSQLIGQVRLETAMHMLRDPDRKIIDIAYRLGYGDPSHFSRAFRRVVGASPNRYRQRLRLSATAFGPHLAGRMTPSAKSAGAVRGMYPLHRLRPADLTYRGTDMD